MPQSSFFTKGWLKFECDPVLKNWVDHTVIEASKTVSKKEHSHWLRCGGTWFAGVNALSNDSRGSVDGGPVLAGKVIEFIRESLHPPGPCWDRGQISVCYPGYPKPMQSESAAAFKYRINRDAAHVDGILAEGTTRRRYLREYHSFVLGVPMVESSPAASPLVVWEGSHEFIRNAFTARFRGIPPQRWRDVDITDIYQQTRREIFKHCRRVTLHAGPGESYIIHRLCLHGMAPWKKNADSGVACRMICYFRPELSGPWQWLKKP